MIYGKTDDLCNQAIGYGQENTDGTVYLEEEAGYRQWLFSNMYFV